MSEQQTIWFIDRRNELYEVQVKENKSVYFITSYKCISGHMSLSTKTISRDNRGIYTDFWKALVQYSNDTQERINAYKRLIGVLEGCMNLVSDYARSQVDGD